MDLPVRFTVLRYPQHFGEICDLRRRAYGEAGKFGPDPVETDAPDRRDRDACVVAGWVGEAPGNRILVTSIRLNPPIPGTRLHFTCKLRGDVASLPAAEDTTECGWGCVHPDFRGCGLLWELAAHMLMVARQMGRPYVLSGTDADVWPMWQRVGYRRTDATYTGALSGNNYWVMVLDIDAVLSGRQPLGRRFAAALETVQERLASASRVDELWCGV